MKKGFTLVELAIVLVIIGFLVGGVLQGQELIKQSTIRAQIAQFEEINRAALTFQTKYNALPGDMKNATSFWGALDDCRTDDRTGITATCDGNGNDVVGDDSMIFERAFFWQHLSNAQLVSQSFGGTVDSGDQDQLKSIAMPAKLGGVGITVRPTDFYGLEPALRTLNKHIYILAGQAGMEDVMLLDPIITPENAHALDSKLDDGAPSTGKISTEMAFYDNTRCRDGSNPPQYDVSDASNTCALIVGTGF